ncbi:translation initiation factor 2 subunit 2, partial [Phenoliferia sp. Uapishka_3]
MSNDPTLEEGPGDMFAGMKKKKKSSKKVNFDELDLESTPAPVEATPAPVEAAPAEEAAPVEEGELDFSDLKKKKKKKSVRIATSDDDEPTPSASAVDSFGNTTVSATPAPAARVEESEAATGDNDEFADLKKKKKKGSSKKAAFDLEAFEKEIAEGKEEGEDGENDGDEGEVPEGEDPFKNEDAEEGEGVSKAIAAAEAKAWLKEGDRDYHYTELLGRFYTLLYASHPSLSASGTKKKYTLAPPQMHRDGNKRSIFANVVDICKKMHRQPEHVIQFLFAELGTSGSVSGDGKLVLKGRYVQKQIETVLRRYITEYVSCRTCKSPDTLLDKENRLFFMTCESCGSKRSVQAIKSGFQCVTFYLWATGITHAPYVTYCFNHKGLKLESVVLCELDRGREENAQELLFRVYEEMQRQKSTSSLCVFLTCLLIRYLSCDLVSDSSTSVGAGTTKYDASLRFCRPPHAAGALAAASSALMTQDKDLVDEYEADDKDPKLGGGLNPNGGPFSKARAEKTLTTKEEWDDAWEEIKASQLTNPTAIHFADAGAPTTSSPRGREYSDQSSVSSSTSSSSSHLRRRSDSISRSLHTPLLPHNSNRGRRNSSPHPLPAYLSSNGKNAILRRPFKFILIVTALLLVVFAGSRAGNVDIHDLRLEDLKEHLHDLHLPTFDTKVAEVTPAPPASCDPCVLDPLDPLCGYGMDNIRLSEMYMGSGHRVRRVMEKALRGDRVSIGIIGASVTAGHGVEGHLKWQEVFLADWMEVFPNTTVYDGSRPGMNSEFYSFCFDAFVPPTADLYLVELDINNDNNEGSYKADDALYRGLLQLPQKPAVIRISVLAMCFNELSRGTPSALTMSNYFDIPMIGIKNFVLPHMLLHPNDTSVWFHDDNDGTITRHISHTGHRALGDMLALYMRKQRCETERRLENPPVPPTKMWPGQDILEAIPDQYLWTPWVPDAHIPPLHPRCSLVGSQWRPLETLPSTSPEWQLTEWNGKAAMASFEPGTSISMPFNGIKIGIFVWSTNGLKNEVKPGRAFCFVDGDRERGINLDAYVDSEYSFSRWWMLHEDLVPGDHVLTCQIITDSTTGGHDFRILGIGSQ